VVPVAVPVAVPATEKAAETVAVAEALARAVLVKTASPPVPVRHAAVVAVSTKTKSSRGTPVLARLASRSS